MPLILWIFDFFFKLWNFGIFEIFEKKKYLGNTDWKGFRNVSKIFGVFPLPTPGAFLTSL